MTRAFPAAPALAALVSLTSVACARPGPQVAVFSARQPLTGSCVGGGESFVEFESEVDKVRLTISGPGIETPLAVEDTALGAQFIEDVPAGENRAVGLFGYVGEAARVWRGVAQNVTVLDDEDTTVSLLMARIGDVSCARNADSVGRAFHTATVLDDGKILLVGGAAAIADASGTCPGCRSLTATEEAALFDPQDGTFTTIAVMASPRMFHTATKLADGRVVIAGGTASALLRPNDDAAPFPIVPGAAQASVEVFDPQAGGFSSGGADPADGRIFAAAAPTVDGEVIITGGVPGPSLQNDLDNALNTTRICGGSPLVCRDGPPMNARRAGHVAFTILDPPGIFVWGGSIDTGLIPGSNVPGFQIEALSSGAGFQLLPVEQMFNSRNLFFAAAVQYLPFRMLVAGGLVRNADKTFSPATVDVGGVTAGPVYIYDPTSIGEFGGIVKGPEGGAPMHIQSPRFFGSAAPLPDSVRAMIAGGYAGLGLEPSDEMELFDQKTLVVGPVLREGPRSLIEPRAGLVAVADGRGAIFYTGGEAPDGNGGRASVATAEIFADLLTPPGVAE